MTTESYIQLPTDEDGQKLAVHNLTRGGQTVVIQDQILVDPTDGSPLSIINKNLGVSSYLPDIPRTIHKASGTLPFGGTYTNQSSFIIPEGIRRITYWVMYTRGASGGYPLFKVMWGNGTEEGQDPVLTNGSSPTLSLRPIRGPSPLDGAPVSLPIILRVPGGATTGRLLVAEGGTPATPGTCQVTITAGLT
jgi:hypothetical protein